MKIQNENCFCCTDYSILKLLAVITLIKSCHCFCQAFHNMRHLHFSPTCVYFSNYKWILLLTPPLPPSFPPHHHRVSCCPSLGCAQRNQGNWERRKNMNYQQSQCFPAIKSYKVGLPCGARGARNPPAPLWLIVRCCRRNQQHNSHFLID